MQLYTVPTAGVTKTKVGTETSAQRRPSGPFLAATATSACFANPMFGHKTRILSKEHKLTLNSSVQEIYDAIAPQVHAICLKYAKNFSNNQTNRDLTYELNQFVWIDLVEMLQDRDKLKVAKNIGWYLVGAAHNHVREYFRMKSTRVEKEKISLKSDIEEEEAKGYGIDIINPKTPEDSILAKENQANLEKGLKALMKARPGQGYLLKIKYGITLTNQDIARILDLKSAKEVEKYTRCLKNLMLENIFRLHLCADYSAEQIAQALKTHKLSLIEQQLSRLQDPIFYKVIRLKLGGDYSHEELGKLLGINDGTVKSQVSRGTRFLKEYFKEHRLI